MWFFLIDLYKSDPNNPMRDLGLRLRLLFLTTCFLFVPVYAYVERTGMGNGSILDSIGNTLYFVQVVVFTIGFGDFSPKTVLGKIIFCLYAGHAVYMGAGILSAASDVRDHINHLKRIGKFMTKQLHDHIIIFARSSEFVDHSDSMKKLITEFNTHPLFSENPILLVDTSQTSDGHSAILELIYGATTECHNMHQSITDDCIYSEAFMKQIGMLNCKTCIILEQDNDASTAQLIERIASLPTMTMDKVHCEVSSTYFRETVKKHGIGGAYRPNRHYPEFIVCTIATPGADDFLTEVVSSSANTLYSIPAPCGFHLPLTWGKLCARLWMNDFDALPIGYKAADMTTIINPAMTDVVFDMHSIICLVNSDRVTHESLTHISLNLPNPETQA